MNEQVREAGISDWLRSASFDCRYAIRQFRKSPGISAIIVLTLALGIGAATAIFTVVNGVLLQPLPYADSSRIMSVFEVTSKGTWSRLADPNFDDFRERNRSFSRSRSTPISQHPEYFRGNADVPFRARRY